MVYWIHKKNAAYQEWQIIDAINEKRLLEEDYTMIEDETWNALLIEASANNEIIVNDQSTNMPILAPIIESKEDMINNEIAENKRYLMETDYCVIKCTELGKPLLALYPEVAEKRKLARSRINELEQLLSPSEQITT